MTKKPTARILIYDIETCFAIGLFFGRRYEVNIAKIIKDEHLFGFAYQWLGEKKIHTNYIWDYPGFDKPLKPKVMNLEGFLAALEERVRTYEAKVVQHWADRVKEADILIGHNSDSFDYRQMHGRIMQHKLNPIPKPQQVDTKKLAKRLGYYESNKLDDLSKRFKNGGKLSHEGIELWWKCLNNDIKARKHMVKYNKVDVEKTTKLYLDFRPYDERHPNMKQIAGRPTDCAVSGCIDPGFTAEGLKHTKTASYQRWKCKRCKSYQPYGPKDKVAGRV